MTEPRKFYSRRTQIFEQLGDTPDHDVDANIRQSMSRGLAELIAKLLTEHFENEAENDDAG